MSSGGSRYSPAEVELALAGLGGALALRRGRLARHDLHARSAGRLVGRRVGERVSGAKGLSSSPSSAAGVLGCALTSGSVIGGSGGADDVELGFVPAVPMAALPPDAGGP